MNIEKNNSQLSPNNLSFSLKCPWCLKIITAQNFSEEQLSVTYLQNYFASQEKQYKEELLGRNATSYWKFSTSYSIERRK